MRVGEGGNWAAVVDGWDVLLSGERGAAGRMDLRDGRRVQGKVRLEGALGVRVVGDVRIDAEPGASDGGEALVEGGSAAGGLEAAVA